MKVSLREIRLSDTANIVRWRNSDDVRRNLFTQNDLTEEEHINWLHSKVETGMCAQYIIQVDNDDTIHDVGTTFIKGIDREKLEGEFGIFIGDSQYRGKHLASLASQEMLRIGFQELHLQRVFLSVFADNTPAIKSYLKVGFNTLKTTDIVNNKKVLLMEIKAANFESPTICKNNFFNT